MNIQKQTERYTIPKIFNGMSNLIELGKEKGLYFVPAKGKKVYIAGWPKKTFTIEDFEEDDNIGLNLGKSGVICIDIDTKEENRLSRQDKEKIDKLVRKIRNEKIPVDVSTSHEGYHIYIKIYRDQEDRFRNKFKKFYSTDLYANNVLEIRTGDKIALIPPSIYEGEQAYYINSNILNIDYLSDKELKQVTNIILRICRIKTHETLKNALSFLVPICIFVAIITVYGGYQAKLDYKSDIENYWDNIKPYVHGTETIKACYSNLYSRNCYPLRAYISNGQIKKIYFTDGSYLSFSADIDEYGTASSIDKNGISWDFFVDIYSPIIHDAYSSWINSNEGVFLKQK